MKTRFNTYDLVRSVTELQRLIGMRVNQIYDIDHRTYLIRLQRAEEKCILLLESGIRIHTTAFEWPKSVTPSGFSMKLRKHLKNKRLESLQQIGVDRIVDLQFGIDQAAYHVILELYDRGNIVLTDREMTILNVLRPHTEGDKIRFVAKETYPLDRARTTCMPPMEKIHEYVRTAKPGDSLRKLLNPHLEFGSAVIDHVLSNVGLELGCKIGKGFDPSEDMPRLTSALEEASEMFDAAKKRTVDKGYVIRKKESKLLPDGTDEFILVNVEFHPTLFKQHENQPYQEFESFDLAVDEYFSTMEGQKLDLKSLQQEREALKKLDNVRKDHDQRLISLEKTQRVDEHKAELIGRNQGLVDNAILAIQSALANQMSWPDIQALLKEAQSREDPVARAVKQLKLETNHIALLLSDPYEDSDREGGQEEEEEEEGALKPTIVDIDLAHSAFGNATKYYNKRRMAARKQQKTIESQGKAFKSAEKRTKQTMKEVQTIHSINKARKVYWFEKFYWFVSSENYLVIGGRDQQQNELIVKRYLRTGDVYVHADLTGASSIVIKNPSGAPVPPKTLAEAGSMAVSYSIAWEAKVVAGAWWVHSDQVSKTAPTGEYLTSGSFMIRGKKNYLPPSQLIMGLGILFRLEDSCIGRHKDERKVRVPEEEEEEGTAIAESDREIQVEDSEGADEEPENEGTSGPSEETAVDTTKATTVEEKDNVETESSDSESVFPDTQIKIDLSGSRMKLRVDNVETARKMESGQEEIVVYLGDDKPVVVRGGAQNAERATGRMKQQPAEKQEEKRETEKASVLPKRGQKGRLKRMKEKYKDQDEEDRRLLMEALKSAGTAKGEKRKSRNRDPSGPKQQGRKKDTPFKLDPNRGQVVLRADDNLEEEDIGPGPEVDMLDQLTGKPVVEDELLFAIPVVAPYNTLISYKYKVKLTPGTGKRGKATKTAIATFLRDKAITHRERDVLKAVKDEMVARNIPGKVKLSAPQVQKFKK